MKPCKNFQNARKKTACFRCGNSGMSRLRDNSKLVKVRWTHFAVKTTWQTLGIPTVQPVTVQYQVAEGSPLPVVGQFQSTASIDGKS